jgi:hypothetical protein
MYSLYCNCAVTEELKKYPSMKLLPNGVFYHEEIAEKAAEVVMKAQYEYLEGKNKDLVMIKTNNYNLAVSVIS